MDRVKSFRRIEAVASDTEHPQVLSAQPDIDAFGHRRSREIAICRSIFLRAAA
jgi:hypothetical protein